MRITGGLACGIQIKAVDSNTRPATDQLREAVFSSLGNATVNASFIDVFAGTGSYGLEAISRGARAGSFIDKNQASLRVVNANLLTVLKSVASATGEDIAKHNFQTIRMDLLKTVRLQDPGEPVTLIFVDPPYPAFEESIPAIESFIQHLSPDGRLIVEHPADHIIQLSQKVTLISRLGKRKGQKSPAASIFKRATP